MKKVMKDGKEYIVFENYQDMVAHREICANLVNTLMKPVQTERNETYDE